MDNKLQLFNFEGNQVRTLEIKNEPWFVGKDVTEILGYKNSSKALKDHVDEEDKLNNDSLSSLGQRGGWLVNESGLYSFKEANMMRKEDLGKTKLDHVLSYISYALRDACVLGVSVVFIYWAIYWINQLISNWIYKAL